MSESNASDKNIPWNSLFSSAIAQVFDPHRQGLFAAIEQKPSQFLDEVPSFRDTTYLDFECRHADWQLMVRPCRSAIGMRL
jgi:hypothetical protein